MSNRSLLPHNVARSSHLHPTLLSQLPFYWGTLGGEVGEELAQWAKPCGLTISEKGDMVQVEADMPGMKPEDIELTLEQGVLWIRGERSFEEKEKKFYSKSSSSYSYRVAVPGQIDESKEPEASYEAGVLRVNLHKTKKSQAKRILVQKNGKNKK